MVDRPTFLRTVLLLDAISCLAMGALMTLGASSLSSMTLIPSSVLGLAGVSLFPIAAFIAVIALREPLVAGAVWLVILGNVAWVIGSLVLLFDAGFSPNVLGIAFIALQAVAVAILAELEFAGLRRMFVQA